MTGLDTSSITDLANLGLSNGVVPTALDTPFSTSETPFERIIGTVSRVGGVATFVAVLGSLSYLLF